VQHSFGEAAATTAVDVTLVAPSADRVTPHIEHVSEDSADHAAGRGVTVSDAGQGLPPPPLVTIGRRRVAPALADALPPPASAPLSMATPPRASEASSAVQLAAVTDAERSGTLTSEQATAMRLQIITGSAVISTPAPSSASKMPAQPVTQEQTKPTGDVERRHAIGTAEQPVLDGQLWVRQFSVGVCRLCRKSNHATVHCPEREVHDPSTFATAVAMNAHVRHMFRSVGKGKVHASMRAPTAPLAVRIARAAAHQWLCEEWDRHVAHAEHTADRKRDREP
jgi:hypothetical protein